VSARRVLLRVSAVCCCARSPRSWAQPLRTPRPLTRSLMLLKAPNTAVCCCCISAGAPGDGGVCVLVLCGKDCGRGCNAAAQRRTRHQALFTHHVGLLLLGRHGARRERGRLASVREAMGAVRQAAQSSILAQGATGRAHPSLTLLLTPLSLATGAASAGVGAWRETNGGSQARGAAWRGSRRPWEGANVTHRVASELLNALLEGRLHLRADRAARRKLELAACLPACVRLVHGSLRGPGRLRCLGPLTTALFEDLCVCASAVGGGGLARERGAKYCRALSECSV